MAVPSLADVPPLVDVASVDVVPSLAAVALAEVFEVALHCMDRTSSNKLKYTCTGTQ